MTAYLMVLFASVFVNNCVFHQVYGICPFLGVSKKTDQALGMGVSVIFVMVVASAVTYPLQCFLLEPLGLSYLQTILYILVIASLVQFLEMVLKKFLPALHRSLGIYLPLITTNCAVLGVTVDNASAHYSFFGSVVTAFGCGLGFLLALVLFSGVRSRLENTKTAKSFAGLPLTLAAAAIVSLSFGGFTGMLTIPTPETAPFLYRKSAATSGSGSLFLDILFAVLTLTVVGFLAALLLTVAKKKLAVPENEAEKAARACLPGANCGACGYAGCDGYAKAVAADEGVPINLCVPGADKTARALSEALHREFQDVVEQVAFVSCNGSCNASPVQNDYEGVRSCRGAKMFFGGPYGCAYGCIGYGDCAAVCPENAICVEDGLARVDPRLCIGCGKCKNACPQGLISLIPDVSRVAVFCHNPENAMAVKKLCSVGCIGCGKCSRTCEAGAITMVHNLPVIDPEKCTGCQQCVKNCPAGTLQMKVFSGKHRNEN